jgi:hypothetical protein
MKIEPQDDNQKKITILRSELKTLSWSLTTINNFENSTQLKNWDFLFSEELEEKINAVLRKTQEKIIVLFLSTLETSFLLTAHILCLEIVGKNYSTYTGISWEEASALKEQIGDDFIDFVNP